VTSYSVFGGTLPPSASSAFENDSLDIGIQFKITADGCHLAGYYWYLPVSGDTNAADYSFRLYSTTTGTSGTLITGSTVTGSGTWTAGAWNFTALPSPVALVNGTTYVAVCTMPSTQLEYTTVPGFWSTSGIISGPIDAPSAPAALGGKQQTFNGPSNGGMPVNDTNDSFYGIDISVTLTPAAVLTLIRHHRNTQPPHRHRGHLIQFQTAGLAAMPPLVHPPRRAHLPPHHRHGRLLWFQPANYYTPPAPPLVHRHRNARYRPHRGRHLTWAPVIIPPIPPAPSAGPVLSATATRWKWTAGGARNG
jgi:Domain of unknown function (DUF4082)